MDEDTGIEVIKNPAESGDGVTKYNVFVDVDLFTLLVDPDKEVAATKVAALLAKGHWVESESPGFLVAGYKVDENTGFVSAARSDGGCKPGG